MPSGAVRSIGRSISRMTGVLCLAVALLAVHRADAQKLPSGFYLENAAGSAGFTTPTALAFAPDGRIFVAEKRGHVYVIENGAKRSTPFINLEAEVLNHHDRGLLGIALDPNFASNGLVYLMYTVDRNGTGDYSRKDVFGRVVRYAASSSNPNVADLATRTVLIGQDFSSGIAACYFSHAPGTLRFGADGTLLVSTGDGASYSEVDEGGLYPECFGSNRIDPIEDIGAFRSIYLPSLAGKILRIDPQTGQGLPSNPYYTGNPDDVESKVWAYGLRNPFRFGVRPDGSPDPAAGDPGSLFIGDVGWDTWEEINVSENGGGENFGWPCREGPNAQLNYENASPAHSGCSTMSAAASPLMYWHHSKSSQSNPPGLRNNAVVGGDFYAGSKYPTFYNGRVFYGDYTRGWIASASVDASNNLVDHQVFGTSLGSPVDIVYDPQSQYLYFVDIGAGRIQRIRHTNENAPPIAVAEAAPTNGSSPLTVQFTGSGSSDPGGGALTYSWDFGNGDTSTEADPLYTYSSPSTFTATLTVTEPDGLTATDNVVITVGNSAPAAQIVAPVNGASASVGDIVALEASGTDGSDPESSLQYQWEIIQVHNDHDHPALFTSNEKTTSFLVEEHGVSEEVTYLKVQLTVTDTGGLTDVVTHYLLVTVDDEIDITAQGTPIALIDNPNRDINVIMDGVHPPVGADLPDQQYDTDTGTARTEDWIGYSYSLPQAFNRLVFQEGMHFADGGWFEDLRVEVRSGGIWSEVLYLTSIVPYAGNDGENFNTYALLFNGNVGDAIRIIGPPGGAERFISVAELRVFALPRVDFTASPQSGESPLEVTFTDISTVPNPTSWNWDFGDGTTSSLQHPVHTYSSAGPLTVRLTVTDASGTTYEEKVNYIFVGGNGIVGDYYDNEDFTGTLLTRVDPVINFDWGTGSPDPSIAADSFSVRWSGYLQPAFSETYTFHTYTDDGVRLWVDGQLLVDRWVSQSATEWTGTVSLEAGRFYGITMEVYEAGGDAVSKLYWSSPSQSKEIIPNDRLFHPSTSSGIPPTASFTASPTEGDAPLTVAFDASASFDSDGTIVDYEWDFGDGSTASGVSQSHTYSTAGSYAAVLTVTDDAGKTAAASGAITVNPNEPATASDEFNAPTLDGSLWTLVDPLGGATVTMTGTQASISIPAGPDHDPWTVGNTATRLLQSVENTDFVVEAKFDSPLDTDIQNQGLLFEETASRFVRFDAYNIGMQYKIFAAFVDGSAQQTYVDQSIAPGTPFWFRVSRTGLTWTCSYSYDGSTWTVAASFERALSMTHMGPYAGNFGWGNAPPHTALVDYFRSTGTPSGDGGDVTPPVISSIASGPSSSTVTISWNTDEPTTGGVEYGPTSALGTTVNDDVIATSHSVTITGLTSDTQYFFRVHAADGSGNTASSAVTSFTTTSSAPSASSDEFNASTLDGSLWTLVDPLGGATVTMTGTQASISIPAGPDHDPWTVGNTATRLLQSVENTDFVVEAKFDSPLDTDIQNQGLLFEETASRFVRFDAYNIGTQYKIFAAFVDGSAQQTYVDQSIAPGTPFWFRVSRTGLTWTCSYSYDGGTWTVAASFERALNMTHMGPYVGNFGWGNAPPHTALVDYFRTGSGEAGTAAKTTAASGHESSVSAQSEKQADWLPLAADLKAVQTGTSVELNWASEVPDAEFEVQYGVGDVFQTMTSVRSQEDTSSFANPFSFHEDLRYVEQAVQPGRHRYRLKQVQPDGTERYSAIVEVDVQFIEEYRLSEAYPNPFNPQTQLTLAVREAQRVKVEVFSAIGRRVAVLYNDKLHPGESQLIRFKGSGLPSGLYVIRVQGESFADHRSVVFLK